jgi:hypothetical protein
MNILEKLQQHFAYPPLKKIDSNTQEIVHDKDETPEQLFGQGAIPAVLLGLRQLSASDEGAQLITAPPELPDWIPFLFPGNSMDVVQKVAAYSGFPPELVYEKMNEIASQAVKMITKEAGDDDLLLNVKKVMESQLTDTLAYLPAALQLGKVFDNNVLDDRTHKMDGPVSDLMHSIGAAFTNADEDEKKKK